MGEETRIELSEELVQARADTTKREIDMRLLPWEHVIETKQGPEMFKRGAFAGTDPSNVYLYSPNHEARMGLGQDGHVIATRVPIGRAIAMSEPEDGPHITFKVARTAAGDETLALVGDGIFSGVSAEFREVPNGTELAQLNGRRTRIHHRAQLTGATTTPIPAYGERAAVLAIRTDHTEEQVSEVSVTANPEIDTATANAVMKATIAEMAEQFRSKDNEFSTRILDRLDAIEARGRQDIIVPASPAVQERTSRQRTGEWFKAVVRTMTGEHVSSEQMRTLDPLITSDNIGVVPDAVLQSELVGIIDPTRPFLQTTRQLTLPAAGMSLVVPVINTRPTVAVQSQEKGDVDSTPTSIGTTSFDAVTVAGGGDISIQLLKRSDPAYLDLYLQLLAEAYAFESDSLAIATLLDSHPTPGTGYLDAEDLTIGEAWTNATGVSRLLRPDHIWMSTLAIQQFIDAKNDGSNAPLYSNLAANITVGGGAAGLISGLIPVYVPALDGSGADVIIGPSRGFAWAEDGTFTLQVDVPSKAGRDVALVGILWFCPLYPAAFTTYRFAS